MKVLDKFENGDYFVRCSCGNEVRKRPKDTVACTCEHPKKAEKHHKLYKSVVKVLNEPKPLPKIKRVTCENCKHDSLETQKRFGVFCLIDPGEDENGQCTGWELTIRDGKKSSSIECDESHTVTRTENF